MESCNTSKCAKMRMILRMVTGAGFLVFGLNKLLQFMPMEMPINEGGMAIMGAFMDSGLMSALGVVEAGVGLGLILGLLLPLNALAALAMSISFVVFHAFFGPAGLVAPIIFLVLSGMLVFSMPALKKALCCCKKSCGTQSSCSTGACAKKQ